MTYAESVQRLLTIVAEIKQDVLNVDILFEKVKEASRLINSCREKLFEVDGDLKKMLEGMP